MKNKKWAISLFAAIAIFTQVGCQKKAESVQGVSQPGSQIQLEKAVNVRDLGGIQTKEGKTIKPHKLLRGAELSLLSLKDKEVLLKNYGLQTVVDFRTDSEVEQKPDPAMWEEEVYYRHLPVMKDTGSSASSTDFMASLMKMEHAGDYLVKVNQDLVNSPEAQKGYKEFFDLLLKEKEGAILYHCTAGKDRTGFATALILTALGVEKEVVMKDYLRSNEYREKENRQQVEAVAKATNNNHQAMQAMDDLMRVKEEYLQAAFDEIEKNYGDTSRYLQDVLGMEAKKIKKLKNIYLQ